MKKNIFLSQILTLTLSLLLSQQAYANFTYEGHLTDLADNPISGPIYVRVSILTPTTSCIIFQETHSAVPTDVKGVFSIQVGGGTASGGLSNIFDSVFKNDVTITGIGSCAYTPGPVDSRRMQIEISTDGGTTYEPLIGTIALGKAPQATNADFVGGFDATRLFRVAADATAPTLSLAQVTEFNALIAGNSTLYLQNNGNTNISSPTVIAGTGGTGSSSAPAYSFSGDTTTGIFHPQANTLGFAVGGVEGMQITKNLGSTTLNVNGHIGSSGPLPTLSSCGTGTLEPGSNDTRGRIVLGTTPTNPCLITFNIPFSTPPFCVVSWAGATIPAFGMSVIESLGALTIKFSTIPTGGFALNYHCLQ